VIYLKNKFVQELIVSLVCIVIGSIEVIFDPSVVGYLNIFVGGILLIISMVSYIKYRNNKEEIDKELSKDYDERDDLIDGKVAKFTLRILISVIFIMMFLSNWIMIRTNAALGTILISFIVTEFLSRKYYNHVI